MVVKCDILFPAFALSVANSDDVVTIGFLPLLEDDLSLCVEDERQPCKVRCFFSFGRFIVDV